MALTKNSLNKLRRRLPAGAAPAVALRLRGKYSRQYVYMVLKGDRYNQEVIVELIRMAEEEEKRNAALNARAAGATA